MNSYPFLQLEILHCRVLQLWTHLQIVQTLDSIDKDEVNGNLSIARDSENNASVSVVNNLYDLLEIILPCVYGTRYLKKTLFK